jgi:YggT family protein
MKLLALLLAAVIAISSVSGMSVPARNSNVLKMQRREGSALSKPLPASGRNREPMAMAIPGYGLTEQIFVGGFSNFIQAYNLVITGRVLLSWFPQAQSVGILQPVFAITDPYLNLFRGVIPPIFGFDLSPLLAFFALNVAGQATAAVGMEPPSMESIGGRVRKFGQRRLVMPASRPAKNYGV